MDFAIPTDNGMKTKERGKRNKYIQTMEITKKAVEHEGDVDTSWSAWNGPKRFGKGTGRVRNVIKNWNYPDDSIAENDQNTEKSPWDLWRLALTQNPLKGRQLTQVWKNLQGVQY